MAASTSRAFAAPTRIAPARTSTSRPRRRPASVSASASAISTAWTALERSVAGTDKGLTCTDAQRAEIEDAILRLEALNPTAVPSDSLALEGAWEVTYSNAPPPSNGSLGPFKGTAYQEINLADGTYANRLTVPPNDWLGATLRADWEREVNDLIDGAKTDVDLAVNDIEEAIKEQREEWRRNVEVFEEQWITAPTRALGPRFRRNATGPDGTPYPEPEP